MHRLALSPSGYRRLAGWALVLLIAIVATGGAVRVTGSGLGCSDWPTCEQDQFVPPWSFHPWVEFGNRLITGLVSLGVIAAVAGAWFRRPRRADLVWLAAGLVAGVLAQILLGAALVKTDLDPRFTMGHYLLSAVLVANAVVLWHGAKADRAKRRPGRAVAPGRVAWAAVGAAGLVLVLGTVVTGAGPHGGDDGAARLNLIISEVARLHSLAAWLLCALLVGLIVVVRRTPQIENRLRLLEFVVALVVGQGALGYLQYALDVPAGLVAVHLTLAMVIWAALIHLALDLSGWPAAIEGPGGSDPVTSPRRADEPVLSTG